MNKKLIDVERVRLRAPLIGLCFLAITASPISNAEYLIPRSQIEDFGSSLGAAPSSVPRPMTSLGIGLLIDFEGWRPAAYNDPAGLCTIGFGHLIAMKKCADIDLQQFAKPLTKDQGLTLLDEDTRSSRAVIQKLVTRNLDDNEFSALSSFAFNVGKTNFGKSTLLKYVNSGDDKYAASEFQRWVKSKGQVYKGLQDRRACESALFLGRIIGGGDGMFKRAECVTLGAAPSAGSLIDIDVGEN